MKRLVLAAVAVTMEALSACGGPSSPSDAGAITLTVDQGRAYRVRLFDGEHVRYTACLNVALVDMSRLVTLDTVTYSVLGPDGTTYNQMNDVLYPMSRRCPRDSQS
jgi:hypothetical protein